MKRSTKVKWGEIKVGVLITIALFVLVWASFSGSGTSIFDKKVKFVAYFDNVNGLVKGAPVWIAGVEVGNVSSIKFVNLDSAGQIELKLRVKESVTNMITIDARIRLGTIGMLGDKYLEIIPGTLGKQLIAEDGAIKTDAKGDLAAIMSEGEELISSSRKTMGNLCDITKQIQNGEGTLGQLISNDELHVELAGLISSMTILMDGLQKNQERITGAMENMSSDLADVTAKANSNTGTIGKLLSDPKLYDNLNSSTGRIDSILSKINQGQGTAGAIVNDDDLYQEVKNLVVRIENLVTDIEQNPSKYLKFSVF
ncbi:MAG: MCE family protein [candidate division Zixibacteria bacterium]|nr:MCE family protein [candidate division Zixibacteria bacterium]